MDSEALKGLTILVAEDEYMIATDLSQDLVRAGVRVLGPVSSLDGVMELIEDAEHIDCAFLDVNLQGEKVFPAAELLEKQGVPFLFATGYDQSAIPPRFKDVTRCEKPIGSKHLSRLLTTMINEAG